jgi:hypothetical protein
MNLAKNIFGQAKATTSKPPPSQIKGNENIANKNKKI